LKLAYEFTRRTGRSRSRHSSPCKERYHGDTVGAVSLGHIDLFHKAYAGLLFKSDQVMAPYCYRCPFNRARPNAPTPATIANATGMPGQAGAEVRGPEEAGQSLCRFAFEPLMQGSAGMVPQPAGWLSRAAGSLALTGHY